MFNKRKTVINGVELPEEFSGASIINNVAISNDGTKYAVITKGGLAISDIPEDGKIEINGTVINYSKSKKSSGGIYISSFKGGSVISSIGRGSVAISSGSISIGGRISIGGKSLDYEVDETYQLKEGDEVALSTKNEEINLGLRNGNQIRVKGYTASKPSYSKGRLCIDELDGNLELPKEISDLELALETKNGSINGEIMHPGYVETKNGSIVLALLAPLIVDASTKNGNVNVIGMMSEGHGRYIPVGVKSIGKLRASTKNGSVVINYIKR